MTVTTDLSKFGMREIIETRNLLNEWIEKGLPKDFYDENIKVMFNMNSGDVFLTNDDYQVCMLNNGKLESFYSCPECGEEGFIEDFLHPDTNLCCKQYLNPEAA